jgi:dienelactone hydrolase
MVQLGVGEIGMITYINGSNIAIVILHEIYGINKHITEVCRKYSNYGYDVYCPDLLNIETPFNYSQQEAAYSNFIKNVGFDACCKVDKLLEQLRPDYRIVILIGFSVGATIAWRCSESGLCNGIVGYYGSRIRDYLTVIPKCRVLLMFAENERFFDARQIKLSHEQNKCVTIEVVKGNHGFCDTFSDNFNPESAKKAQKSVDGFCQSIIIDT